MATRSITEKEFEEFTRTAATPFLADFYADWCGPCKMLAPVLEKLSAEYPEVLILKVNVDGQPALASRFQVYSIPTLIAFRGGKEIARRVGVCGKAVILEMLGLGRVH